MPLSTPPTHSTQHRWPLFRQLLGRSGTWVLGLIAIIGLAVPGFLSADPLIAAGGALIGLIAVLVTAAVIAHNRAEKAFFAAYASGRNLALAGRSKLPRTTPMLRKGDDRYAERTLAGSLAEGVSGKLVLYTYEEHSRDSKGNRQTSYHHFTLGLVEIPELRGLVPQLLCQRRSGLRMFEGVEDVFRRAERVSLESDAFHDRFEIFSDPGQDMVWLRRLFSPSFIVWLTEQAPEGLAFEIAGGLLCVDFKGHRKSSEELDEVREVTGLLTHRLREECP